MTRGASGLNTEIKKKVGLWKGESRGSRELEEGGGRPRWIGRTSPWGRRAASLGLLLALSSESCLNRALVSSLPLRITSRKTAVCLIVSFFILLRLVLLRLLLLFLPRPPLSASARLCQSPRSKREIFFLRGPDPCRWRRQKERLFFIYMCVLFFSNPERRFKKKTQKRSCTIHTQRTLCSSEEMEVSRQQPPLIVIIDDLITIIFHYRLRTMTKEKARLRQAGRIPSCTSRPKVRRQTQKEALWKVDLTARREVWSRNCGWQARAEIKQRNDKSLCERVEPDSGVKKKEKKRLNETVWK